DGAVALADVDPVAGALEEVAVPPLALPQRLLGPLALVDVERLHDEVERLPPLVPHQRAGEEDPHLASVPAEVALLELIGGGLAGEQAPDVLEVGAEIGGVGDVPVAEPEQLRLGVAH